MVFRLNHFEWLNKNHSLDYKRSDVAFSCINVCLYHVSIADARLFSKELLLITPKPFIETSLILCLICQETQRESKVKKYEKSNEKEDEMNMFIKPKKEKHKNILMHVFFEFYITRRANVEDVLLCVREMLTSSDKIKLYKLLPFAVRKIEEEREKKQLIHHVPTPTTINVSHTTQKYIIFIFM